MNNKTNTLTIPRITLFVEYKDGRKCRYDTVFKRPNSESSPYDFYFRLKKKVVDNIKEVHLSVEKTAEMPYGINWWKVPLILQSDTNIVMTICNYRVMLDISGSILNTEAQSFIIGYKHIPILDQEGNQLRDIFGPKYIVKPIRMVDKHTIKKVSVDKIPLHIRKIVSCH